MLSIATPAEESSTASKADSHGFEDAISTVAEKSGLGALGAATTEIDRRRAAVYRKIEDG
jgi:hypothetical protein